MDLGTILSAAQTLFAALASSELKEALSIFCYKTQLNDLQDTVETIKAVLSDADPKQELSRQEQIWVQKLKNAVFEADDLFDEFLTLAELERLRKADSGLSKKVSNFFSLSTLRLACRMSRGVKDMKRKLKAILDNTQFLFKIDPPQCSLNIDNDAIRKRSRETCSYVEEAKIVGREDDLESIVGTLLASDDQSDVSVLSIVGIGGLGKTALAQLVYKDPRVRKAFPFKSWTCVADQDQNVLVVKDILAKILGGNQDGLSLEEVQSQLQSKLAGHRFLLVLDDVWTENGHQWSELVQYLNGNKRGSWILLTTRSKETAAITYSQIHELSGLSEENSWSLFERTAFDVNKSNCPVDDELIKIGQEIVHGCAGVPLAIKVAGSLLYGQAKSKWQLVRDIGLANTIEGGNDIMPILKLSYYHLEPPLRNCFSYCALFPKDYEMNKDMLIRLWMAQGYMAPLAHQSIEDAAEEYFSILLKRCFFQDIKKNEYGEIESCKIHDLMHDIAQNVSEKEIYASNTASCGNVNKNVRHLSIFGLSLLENFYCLDYKHIRSLLLFNPGDHCLAVDALVKSFNCLRALDLRDKNIKCLPDSIKELVHLRYINLSKNEEIEALPNSITKLFNLQTLLLYNCNKLKELPKDLSKLINLRVLDMEYCDELRCMPRGMGKLTSLHTLKGEYIVGGEGRCKSWKQWLDGLDALKALNNLKGQLKINLSWPKYAENDLGEERRGNLYLRNMEHLNHIELRFIVEEDSKNTEDLGFTMTLMEGLQPHPNLKRLTIRGYHGLKMPGWAAVLPNLVSLCLYECKKLKYLPCLGNLYNLKFLRLSSLPNLLYIEEDSLLLASTTAEAVSFFPSLESLDFFCLPQFKGWRRGGGMEEPGTNSNQPHFQHCLSQLNKLTISQCPEMKCILLCPNLETLSLTRFNERLQVLCTKKEDKLSEAAIQNPGSSDGILVPKLREVIVDKAAWLDSMPVESFYNIQSLHIHNDRDMVQLPSCIQSFPALRALEVFLCEYLKTMPNWMPKLTHLRHLTLDACSESLKKRCQKYPPGEDWKYIKQIPYISFR